MDRVEFTRRLPPLDYQAAYNIPLHPSSPRHDPLHLADMCYFSLSLRLTHLAKPYTRRIGVLKGSAGGEGYPWLVIRPPVLSGLHEELPSKSVRLAEHLPNIVDFHSGKDHGGPARVDRNQFVAVIIVRRFGEVKVFYVLQKPVIPFRCSFELRQVTQFQQDALVD